MYFDNYQFLKKKEIFVLALLFSISILVRIPTILIFGDTSLENEWKIIVNNLIVYETLSFRSFDEFLLPNLFMPPLYSYYLYFFSIFNLQEQNYIQLILLSQILLSSISVVIFYEINKIFFSHKISFYSSLLFSLFPLHVYACSQVSSVSLQTFFTILFFYFFFQFVKKRNFISTALFSFTGGLLILLRGEFIVILVLTLLYLYIFFRIPLKNILLIFLITLITISPYLIRNILVFETITITKSFGYNLWKGNNPNSTVAGSELIDNGLQKKIDAIPTDKFYGIVIDRVFLNQAIKNLAEEPKRYLILFIQKAASFLFIDIQSSYPNYYNPVHYLPILLIGILSLIGIFLSDKKSYQLNYLILIFFITTIVYSSFFILPRFKLALLPLQIIFSNVCFEYIIIKFFKTK